MSYAARVQERWSTSQASYADGEAGIWMGGIEVAVVLFYLETRYMLISMTGGRDV